LGRSKQINGPVSGFMFEANDVLMAFSEIKLKPVSIIRYFLLDKMLSALEPEAGNWILP
jgi:hypothetical protein